MVERLIESCNRHGRPLSTVSEALQAFDLLSVNAELAQKAVTTALNDAGVDNDEARAIAGRTVHCADFLLRRQDNLAADFVVGNPPYIRLEDVPAARGRAYRRACPTMSGRSDIFVGFIETGLKFKSPSPTTESFLESRPLRRRFSRFTLVLGRTVTKQPP